MASELRAEREKRKVSLAQMAADTRISLRHLESLEEGRYGDLPGGIYNRAFLRAYCEFLNLDQQEIVKRYEAEISPPLDKSSKPRTHLSEDRSIKLSPILVWSIMLVISATGLFFSRRWVSRSLAPYFPHPAPASSALKKATPRPPAPAAAPAPRPALAPVAAPQPPPAPAAASQAAVPLPSPPALRVEFAATERCWVSITGDRNAAIRKTLQPGETETVSAAQQVSAILGNASGIQLRINGHPARQLGKAGEVVRILINQNNLQDLLERTEQ